MKVYKKTLERHGKTLTPEYRSYQHMIGRCYSMSNHKYPTYGGRGIKVCDRWLESFTDFLADMGMRPEGMTIDRIDNNGNYEPNNCKWSTPVEQARNRNLQSNNTSGYKGISWNKRKSKWAVIIKTRGKITSLGYFLDISRAIQARKQGELKYWGP